VIAFVVAVALSQGPRAAVIDVSAPDAIYEDVSRSYAADVVRALDKAGFDARRVDESELPEKGCRFGPCLADVAKANKADVVITLDAVEVDSKKNGVAVAAMWGRNGEPLTVKRYTVKSNGKPPKELAAFATETLAALAKRLAPAPPKPPRPSADAGAGVDAGP